MRPPRHNGREAERVAGGYVELHAHSSYSFCDGASLPQELAAVAAQYGYEAYALTDHDGVYGAMEFAQACKPLGIRPIHGAELTVNAGGEHRHLTLLVENATGWENLCRLITEAHAGTRPRPDRDPLPPEVPLESVLERNEGLVCLSGCARDGLLARPYTNHDSSGREAGQLSRSYSPGREAKEAGRRYSAEQLARRLLSAFGRDRFRIELQRPLWRHDRARNRRLAGLAERLGVPCVATGDVHSHSRARAELQDALVAVRCHTTLEECEAERRGNASSVLAPPAEMAARFADHP